MTIQHIQSKFIKLNVFGGKYEQDHKPTIHTKWYDAPDLQSAKKIAQQISREDCNRGIVQAKCGGNCFPR